ncbi:hypothetical protein QZH41_000613 [Actinostola sp. cb2023]|nr:hypothetical protein QZH41_000613 [Actinostola sp. cb2023]
MRSFLFALLVLTILGTSLAVPEIDFEKVRDVNYFAISPSGSSDYHLSRSPDYHKNGQKSLLWGWPIRQQTITEVKLVLTLGTDKRSSNTELTRGGFKFWMYRVNKTPASTMQLTFVGTDQDGAATRSSPTNVNLNFKGWRGVWIGYGEFQTGQFNLKELLSIEFQITSDNEDTLYIDLIQFVKSMSKQTRDAIVMRIGRPEQRRDKPKHSSSMSSNPSSPSSADPPTYYNTATDFWQQTLNWYEKQSEPLRSEVITDKDAKIRDITNIEDRLANWYVKTDEALGSLGNNENTANADAENGYDFRGAKLERWNALSDNIADAHDQYNKIRFNENRPALFPIVSEFGENNIKDNTEAVTKFGYVFSKVLLPLSLEYNFMSRDVEISYLSKTFCSNLQSQDDTEAYQTALAKVAGKSVYLKNRFQDMVNEAKNENNFNCDEDPSTKRISAMEALINDLNDLRLQRIKKLLEFLQDQGWAEGSGLGTLDHEMNKAGAGFMHSMFLLRHALRRESDLLNSLMGAMRWYNDFNEIYQSEDNYIYDGTTADRMRTILLYRLMIILIVTPSEGNEEDKIRDLENFQTWFKHAVKINKGLGGVIKPDFTGFHHKTFYGAAYAPHALHNAALVQYLLDGTSFALDQESKDNLRKALEVLRIVAVKYSTPNSICGRFPQYDKAVLAEHFPAYAYISHNHPGASKMFLRLLGNNDPLIQAYLEDGKIKSGIYYWNTIGSLDVLKKVSSLECASNQPCHEEPSPTGHWSKNFAALSIHRRQGWSVAVKGFNRYTWDYESSGKENVFGVFGSHGSLQISNSENTLRSYDVNNGWDWARVPGTTTIKVQPRHTKTSKARNYNHEGKFAGGVSFIGSTGGNPQNGAFGMAFKKPAYQMKKELKDTPLDKATFEFKKSYFFYNNLIVCVGSDIKLGNVNKNVNFAQTTLFQDKLLDPVTSTIGIDTTSFNLRDNNNLQRTYENSETVQLQDTNGNIYKVETGENILVVKITNQSSRKRNGCDRSSGNYATAWIKHRATSGSVPAGKRSQTLANTMLSNITHFMRSQIIQGTTANEKLGEDLHTNVDGNEDDYYDDDDYTDDDENNCADNEKMADAARPATGSNPTTQDIYSYKYAILVAGGNTAMLNKYTILRQDENVHAIQFLDNQIKIYGYSIFNNLEATPLNDGPVRSASGSCMIMAEKGAGYLHLAISDPSLKFGFDPSMVNKRTCSTDERNEPNDTFNPKTSDDVSAKMLFCVEGKPSDSITVTLNVRVESIINRVIVDGESSEDNSPPELDNTEEDRSKLIFSNLTNGFTTEVKLILA